MATREFKITCMANVIFLLDSAFVRKVAQGFHIRLHNIKVYSATYYLFGHGQFAQSLLALVLSSINWA